MQKTLLLKLLSIAFLTAVLLVPLGLIENIIGARQDRQEMVEQTIAASSALPQTVVGPLLAIAYTEYVTAEVWDEQLKKYKPNTTAHERVVWFTPEVTRLQVVTDSEPRYKGLYKANVLKSRGRWQARFAVPAGLGLNLPAAAFKPGEAWLAFGLSDSRGILGAPQVTVDGKPLPIRPGTQVQGLQQGIHAALGLWTDTAARDMDMTASMDWLGTGVLSFAPLGKASEVTLQSPWPHPNFVGSFLPRDKSIAESGFTARWDVSQFATQNDRLLKSPNATLETFGVKFIEPVNIYLQAERAVKYGVLFVALTFAAFFLIEVLKSLSIHPLQYGLVGLALAMFFLLTVSLSEHLAFGWSYLGASVACVGLLAFYISHVLKSRAGGVGFGALFGLLYAVLYGLLLSEDNALVLGSLLLFAALATVMVLTRKVDWYHLGSPSTAKS